VTPEDAQTGVRTGGRSRRNGGNRAIFVRLDQDISACQRLTTLRHNVPITSVALSAISLRRSFSLAPPAAERCLDTNLLAPLEGAGAAGSSRAAVGQDGDHALLRFMRASSS